MTLHALIDYDNLRAMPEKTPLDTEINVDRLFTDLAEAVTKMQPAANEVHVRLYSGWIDERGVFTRNARWAVRALTTYRGLRDGVRILPQIATSAMCYPETVLLGTVRRQTVGLRQKMVDGLIIVDAVTLALRGADSICIVSDDDDIVPGVLGVRQLGLREVHLLRTVYRPTALNDTALSACGARIHSLMRYRIP